MIIFLSLKHLLRCSQFTICASRLLPAPSSASPAVSHRNIVCSYFRAMSIPLRSLRCLCRSSIAAPLARSSVRSNLRSPSSVRSVFTKSSPRQADVAATTSSTTASPTPSPAKTATPLPPVQTFASTTSDKLDFSDEPTKLQEDDPSGIDWSSSFSGLAAQPFSKEAANILLAPIEKDDVEIKPDGIIYLPEIKYRRILNRAFGPGGWGLAPRGETIVTDKAVTREYALLALGRYVQSQPRGCQTNMLGLFQSHAANKITSIRTAFLLRPRAANRMH